MLVFISTNKKPIRHYLNNQYMNITSYLLTKFIPWLSKVRLNDFFYLILESNIITPPTNLKSY